MSALHLTYLFCSCRGKRSRTRPFGYQGSILRTLTLQTLVSSPHHMEEHFANRRRCRIYGALYWTFEGPEGYLALFNE